jgi:deazaflavin-dependent oxidoreductase (nitroreductase family)
MSNDFMPLWERALAIPLVKLHDTIYRKTGGRIGHRILPGAPPSLLLHTLGAKSGLPRTTSLSYAEDGDSYLVVGSKGGGPKAPGWYFNLKASPNVEINIGPNRMPAIARIIGEEHPDYKRLWKLVNDNSSHRYDRYQTRTKRTIPIIALTP